MASPRNIPPFIKRLPVFGVLLVYIFVSSGLCISFLCLLLLVIWPFNKTLYRRTVLKLAHCLLGQMVWTSIDWADIQITLYGDDDVYHMFGKESCLISLSHRGEFDWMIGFIVSASFGFLETIKSTPKKSVLFVPGFGQLLWSLEFPFLNRNWQKDEPTISKTLQVYANYPFPIQVCIFCEGSRFTQQKFEEGVLYAKRAGLIPLKHHLVPRTKGYAILAKNLKNDAKFPLAYDVGFAYPSGQQYMNGREISFRDVLGGQTIKVYFYMRKFSMKDIPSSQEELQQFCHDLYVHKDNAYDYFTIHGEYPGPSRPLVFTNDQLTSLRLNQLFWTTLVLILPAILLLLFVESILYLVIVLFGLCVAGTILTYGLLAYARSKRTHKKDTKVR